MSREYLGKRTGFMIRLLPEKIEAIDKFCNKYGINSRNALFTKIVDEYLEKHDN